MVVQDKSGNGEVFVRFGKIEAVYFVDFADFHAARKFVCAVVNFAGEVAWRVVFVLDVSENLLDQVFESDDARGAAIFVDDDGDALFLLHELFHQLLGGHGFGHLEYGANQCFPVGRTLEKIRRVDIADDVVDVVFVDGNFGKSRVGEAFYQALFCRFVDVDGNDFRPWNHALSGVARREFEGVLQDFHLRVYTWVVMGLVEALLQEFVEFVDAHRIFGSLFLHFYARQAQDAVGYDC